MPKKGRRSNAIALIICAQCKMEIIEKEEENIQCDKCKKLFHCLCTRLDKRQYEYLVENEDEEFVCHLCNKDNDNLKEELKEIKTKLNKLDQLTAVTEAVEFMSRQYDEILKGIAENNKKVELVQKENSALKSEIAILKASVKNLNDEKVKNDCIVQGVVVNNDATAIDTMVDISNKIGIEVKKENINDAFFLKKGKNDKTDKRTMVVKFNNKNTKDKFMKSKPKLKEIEDLKSIYVNDYLSRETLQIFNYAKMLRTIGYCAVYTYGGRVYAKKSEISKPRYIKDESEVDKIMSEAATFGNKRKSLNRDTHGQEESDGNHFDFMSPV